MGNAGSMDQHSDLRGHNMPLKLPMPEPGELEERFAIVLVSTYPKNTVVVIWLFPPFFVPTMLQYPGMGQLCVGWTPVLSNTPAPLLFRKGYSDKIQCLLVSNLWAGTLHVLIRVITKISRWSDVLFLCFGPQQSSDEVVAGPLRELNAAATQASSCRTQQVGLSSVAVYMTSPAFKLQSCVSWWMCIGYLIMEHTWT